MAKLIHVVEDDEDIRFIVEYILNESGYKVQTSSTAQDFNNALLSQRPDLVLLDVMLPDGNGIEICREMKTNAQTENIRIIVMSAHATERAAIEQACADDFISKPFDLDYLISRVQKILPS